MVLTMSVLQTALDQLGNELVNCSDGCNGISCNQKKGILPRCLFLEYPDKKRRGCLAVGLNPGISDKYERYFYKQHGNSYCSFKKYWKQELYKKGYHIKVHKLIQGIGLDGPIIWTELVKCEKAKGSKLLPLDTLRHCMKRFLLRELVPELIPIDWPIIGIGKQAFDVLCYIAPERTVIGVPHPTGAWGNSFNNKLFPSGSMNEKFRKLIVKAISSGDPSAIWLGSKK
jgi:hypothetical protein